MGLLCCGVCLFVCLAVVCFWDLVLCVRGCGIMWGGCSTGCGSFTGGEAVTIVHSFLDLQEKNRYVGPQKKEATTNRPRPKTDSPARNAQAYPTVEASPFSFVVRFPFLYWITVKVMLLFALVNRNAGPPSKRLLTRNPRIVQTSRPPPVVDVFPPLGK